MAIRLIPSTIVRDKSGVKTLFPYTYCLKWFKLKNYFKSKGIYEPYIIRKESKSLRKSLNNRYFERILSIHFILTKQFPVLYLQVMSIIVI